MKLNNTVTGFIMYSMWYGIQVCILELLENLGGA